MSHAEEGAEQRQGGSQDLDERGGVTVAGALEHVSDRAGSIRKSEKEGSHEDFFPEAQANQS